MEDLKLKLLKEELDYIIKYNPDPKLSEIHGYIPGWEELFPFWDYFNKRELILYSKTASYLIDDDEEIKEHYELIHEMYRDIILNKKVGFIYDW